MIMLILTSDDIPIIGMRGAPAKCRTGNQNFDPDRQSLKAPVPVSHPASSGWRPTGAQGLMCATSGELPLTQVTWPTRAFPVEQIPA